MGLSVIKNILLILFLTVLIIGCEENQKKESSGSVNDIDVANSPERDAEIQKYNLEQLKKTLS